MKKKFECLIAIGAALFGLCICLCTGADYYVERAGDDTGNGSITNPWQTIGHALSEVGPGQTINIGTGEFRETLGIFKPVTLVGQNTYSSANPPLKRHNSVTVLRAPSGTVGAMIEVNTNSVTIKNLSIYGDPETNGVPAATHGVYTSYRPVSVINCLMANFNGQGIRCLGSTPPPESTDTSLLRSYFSYNLISNITHSTHAIGIYIEQTQATCELNEFSGIRGVNSPAGILVDSCEYTATMGTPITIRSNYFNDCSQGLWANNPTAPGETLVFTDNTITNSIIGIRLTAADGPATIAGNQIHVEGTTPSGLPARGIWVHADANPWGATSATDHVVANNVIMSDAATNNGSIGMFFSYASLPIGENNNGVRASVGTNHVYSFAIGSLIESGTTGVAISNDPLVEVSFQYNDFYNSVTGAILTTGFVYMVDATSNFLGYGDMASAVSTNVNYAGSTNGGSFTLNTDGDALLDYVDLDDDGDGWNDTNEYAAGTYPIRVDSDFDGMNDPQEYIVAGTDPLDASDVLALRQLSTTSTNASFEWPSVTGRTYYVYRTTNLTDGFGSPITNFPASTPTNYYTDASVTGATYFYRISVTN